MPKLIMSVSLMSVKRTPTPPTDFVLHRHDSALAQKIPLPPDCVFPNTLSKHREGGKQNCFFFFAFQLLPPKLFPLPRFLAEEEIFCCKVLAREKQGEKKKRKKKSQQHSPWEARVLLSCCGRVNDEATAPWWSRDRRVTHSRDAASQSNTWWRAATFHSRKLSSRLRPVLLLARQQQTFVGLLFFFSLLRFCSYRMQNNKLVPWNALPHWKRCRRGYTVTRRSHYIEKWAGRPALDFNAELQTFFNHQQFPTGQGNNIFWCSASSHIIFY